MPDSPITESQIDYLRSLVSSASPGSVLEAFETVSGLRYNYTDSVMSSVPHLSRVQASRMIDALRSQREQTVIDSGPRVAAAEGVYIVPPTDDSPDPIVYVVRRSRNGSGRRAAYRLVAPAYAGRRARFVYQRGAVFTLTPDQVITEAEALELGARWSVCVRCGATLTDPTSVSNAIGPVCWRRMFGTTPPRAETTPGERPAPRSRNIARTCNVCGDDYTGTRTTCDECRTETVAEQLPAPIAEPAPAPARRLCTDTNGAYICTLDAGHDGRHMAGGSDVLGQGPVMWNDNNRIGALR